MIDNTDKKGDLTCVGNCAPPVVEIKNEFISERSSVEITNQVDQAPAYFDEFFGL